MKKTRSRKLITLLAAAALFAGTGAETVSMTMPTIAQASTRRNSRRNAHRRGKRNRARRKSRKSTYAYIRARRHALVYKFRFNKNNTKVTGVYHPRHTGYWRRGRSIQAFWSTKVGRYYYYYLGSSFAIKVRSAYRVSRAKVPSLRNYIKAQKTAYNKKAQAYTKKVNAWNKKLSKLAPKATQGTISKNTGYWALNKSTGKFKFASSSLATGEKFNVLFKSNEFLSDNNGNHYDAYFGLTQSGQQALVPASAVNVDVTKVPEAEQYSKELSALNKAYQAARKDLTNIK